MRTRDALQAFTGQSYQIGDGPLANVGRALRENFRSREAERMANADERAYWAGKGPALAVLQRRLAEARAEDLFQDATPCATRFEVFQALKAARSQYPQDRGLKMAAVHAEHLWRNDAMGVLALGDVARLRAHYAAQYPKSVVADVIDREVPKVGFNTLPIHKLAPLAAQVTGNTDEERQYAFEQVVRAHGLHTNKPGNFRARTFIREMADMAVERSPQAFDGSGAGALNRMAERMASFSDPILAAVSRTGQAMTPPPAPGAPDAMGGPPAPPPHDEAMETGETIESPNSGQPLTVELAPAAPAEETLEPPQDEVAPGVVASLAYYGQLESFAPPAPEAGGVDAFDTAGAGAETISVEDPTAPGEMLDVTVAPAQSGVESGMAGTPAPLPPGMDNQASRRRIFSVYAIRGGVRHGTPVERIRAVSMAAALRHVAKNISAASPGASNEVRAHPEHFQNEAFVVLDDACGNYLSVRADVFEPKIVTDGQPVVRHHLELSQSQGKEVLLNEKKLKQTPPKPKKMSEDEAKEACAKRGLTAAVIEARILAGETIRVGTVALKMNDESDIELYRGERGRVASLVHLDKVIADFMVLAALQPVEPEKKLGFSVRALFSVGCNSCGGLAEYLMPDQPQDVRCASCGWVTPVEAVAIQLETRQAAAFPGYVITTDIPGELDVSKITARRMLAAIKEVVKTDGATIRHVDGRPQFEVSVRGAGDTEMNRIRRVLADVFGVRELVAQQVQVGPAPQVGQQHATIPVQPMTQPQPQMQQPQQPQPPQQQAPMPAAETGTGAMNEFIDQHASPPPMVASRLASGDGIQHAHIRYANGQTAWIPVEARSEKAARDIIGSFLDGTEVLEVVDSMRRAQAVPAMSPPTPDAMGAGGQGSGQMATPGDVPGLPSAQPGGAPENIETAALDPQVEEAIRAAMVTARTTGVPIDTAITNIGKSYQPLLDRFGDDASPMRHLLGGVIVRLAKEVYEKPALVAPQAARRTAKDFPEPKKINEQQDDWVKLPGGGKLLGPDTQSGEGFKGPKKIKTQHDIIKDQSGLSGTPTDLGPDSTARDPKRFDAPKPPKDGEVAFDSGPGWGVSYTDTNLGKDTQSDDNGETGAWDGVSKKAPSTIRSK